MTVDKIPAERLLPLPHDQGLAVSLQYEHKSREHMYNHSTRGVAAQEDKGSTSAKHKKKKNSAQSPSELLLDVIPTLPASASVTADPEVREEAAEAIFAVLSQREPSYRVRNDDTSLHNPEFHDKLLRQESVLGDKVLQKCP